MFGKAEWIWRLLGGRLGAALVASLLLGPSAMASETVLFETSFEGVYGAAGEGSGKIHEGWSDDSDWANAKASYSEFHLTEERTCQQIDVLDPGSNRAQMRLLAPLSVKKGKYYTLVLSVRSESPLSAGAGLSKSSPPFTSYLKGDFIAGGEWSELKFSAKAELDDPAARLTLRFPQKGRLWLRRLAVLESDSPPPPPAASELKAGELIPNGDFSLGVFGWSSFGETERSSSNLKETLMRRSIAPPRIEASSADGQRALALELPQDVSSALVSGFIDVVPGGPFTLKAKLRCVEGERAISLKLFGMDWNGPRVEGKAGADWKELSVSGVFPPKGFLQVRPEIVAAGGGAGTLLIASVSLEQKAAVPGAAARREFGVLPSKGMPLYEKGEAVEFDLLSSNAEGMTVRWRIVDSLGSDLGSGAWTLSSSREKFRLEALPAGWRQLRWEAPWADVMKSGSLSFGVVPEARRVAGSSSHFGIHVEGSALGVEKMRLLGVHWLRAQNPLFTKWTAVQPRKDVFLFPDEYVDRFLDAGFEILGNFDRTPKWAARNPGNENPWTDFMDYKADLPNDWDAWQAYVKTMASRYKGKIKYWEVWNEPDIPFLNPPEGMSRAEAYNLLLRKTVPVLKEANPDAVVVGGPAYFLHKRSDSKGYQEDFMERLVEGGGFRLLDVFGFHHYPREMKALDESELPAKRLAWIRSEMAKEGKKPEIWNTEWGFMKFTDSANGTLIPDKRLGIDEAAAEFVRWSAGQLALGVEKLFWYDGQDNFYYHWHCTKNFFDYREPRPAAVACAILTKTLDGLDFKRESRSENGRMLLFAAKDGEERALVAWAKEGRTLEFKLPQGSVAFDYLGRSLPVKEGAVEIRGPSYVVFK